MAEQNHNSLKTLACGDDPHHHHQVPGRKVSITQHPLIQDSLQAADQIEIGAGRNAFGPREESIPPNSDLAGPVGKTF